MLRPKLGRTEFRRLTARAALFVLMLVCGLAVEARAAAPLSIEEALTLLGYTTEQQRAIESGEIVVIDQAALREDHLSAAVAMRLPVPVAALRADALSGRNLQRDPHILVATPLRNGPAAWQALSFGDSEGSEAARLLDYDGDDDFNLSTAEGARLPGGRAGGPRDASRPHVGISALYREILMARHAAYQAEGLAAIAPYQRNGLALYPDTGLAALSSSANNALLQHFPDFAEALAAYPAADTPGVSHGHFWLRREVDGRPLFILAHQVVAGGEGYLLFSMREYFVGHTYEALQFFMLALPAEGGSVVLLVNNAFADKAAGFFSGLARWFGLGRMRDDLRSYFEALKAQAQEF